MRVQSVLHIAEITGITFTHTNYDRFRYIKRRVARKAYRYGTFHGYDAAYRAEQDADRQYKARVERKHRQWLGIGAHEQWPGIGAGGYCYLYYVADSVYAARRDEIDATLCAECLNNNPDLVVLAAEHGDGYDDPVYCDDCGALLAGYENDSDE